MCLLVWKHIYKYIYIFRERLWFTFKEKKIINDSPSGNKTVCYEYNDNNNPKIAIICGVIITIKSSTFYTWTTLEKIYTHHWNPHRPPFVIHLNTSYQLIIISPGSPHITYLILSNCNVFYYFWGVRTVKIKHIFLRSCRMSAISRQSKYLCSNCENAVKSFLI